MAQQKTNAANWLVGFKTVQLFKDQTLGIGSYGKVCKAKCDDLLCAAKLIHETLFDPTSQQLIAPQKEHGLPMRRFQQECEFLSTIRHPNIIQYLGIYEDPDTGLPALLMELMDDSLTHFLEDSKEPIPYHIQVNICHDITLALSFLHSNEIVHRDLSSNNVLLIGNVKAKVTDFGMARLGDQNPRATHLTFTMCPGTDVFMPPEAVRDKPVYTEKIDCFSFGVITLQILTRQFPYPGDRRMEIEINQPGLPAGTMAQIPISEIERRQNHISEINPNHTLLQVALDCLKDRDIERPSSHQLCERVAALKETPEYSKSARDAHKRGTPEQGRGGERDRELRSLRQQHAQQVQDFQKIIQEKVEALRFKDETIEAGQQQLRDEVVRLEREKYQVAEDKEKELSHVSQQLEESEQINAQLQRRITELEQMRLSTDATFRSTQQRMCQARIKMTWREGQKAPKSMSALYNAVADGSTMYIRTGISEVYTYTVSTSSWRQLPNSPTANSPAAIINNCFTLIGGYKREGMVKTNQLYSLTPRKGSGMKWVEKFPPMPTKRHGATALCTESFLIVAGGKDVDVRKLQTVEVMNTETHQWSTTADLLEPLCEAPGAVCGNYVYILSLDSYFKSAMYTCSVSALHQSCLSRSTAGVWNQVAAPPVRDTACVSIHGQLLTIGGKDSNGRAIAAVHMYNPTTDSWEVISHMATPRSNCFAAVHQNNQLMVVGGRDVHFGVLSDTDSVELATVD